MTEIKIFGERNIGTNYVEEIIRKNFVVKLLTNVVPYKYIRRSEKAIDLYFALTEKKNLGWKHCNPNLKSTQAYQSFCELRYPNINQKSNKS